VASDGRGSAARIAICRRRTAFVAPRTSSARRASPRTVATRTACMIASRRGPRPGPTPPVPRRNTDPPTLGAAWAQCRGVGGTLHRLRP